MSSRSCATVVGFGAIVMWSSLSTLVAISGASPPFLLNALTFGLSGDRTARRAAQPARV